MKGGEEALGAEELSGKECFLRKEESSTYSPNLDPSGGGAGGRRRERTDGPQILSKGILSKERKL